MSGEASSIASTRSGRTGGDTHLVEGPLGSTKGFGRKEFVHKSFRDEYLIQRHGSIKDLGALTARINKVMSDLI